MFYYLLQTLQSERRQHREGDMLRNLDLLGMTWSFVPVPKVIFWLPPTFTLQYRPLQNGFLSPATFIWVAFKSLYFSGRESGFH